MTKKFYMTPGSCSTGIHILLAGDQCKKEYLAINPKSSIPALVLDDGSSDHESVKA